MYKNQFYFANISIFIFIITLNSVSAQTSDIRNIKTLSLNECLVIALENNHKIKAQKQNVHISESRKKQAESGYWPDFSVKAAYTLIDQDPVFTIPAFNMDLPQMSFIGTQISLPPFEVPRQDIKVMDNHNIQALLQMTFPIYTGGKLKAINQQAENGIEISRQEYRKSNLEIRYDVTRYYYGALLAGKIYKIASETLERLDITLSLTQSMYENGSGKVTKLDYLRNKVIVDQVRSIVAEIKKNAALSKDALAFTLGTDTLFEIPDEEIPFNKNDIEIVNVGSPVYSENPDWLKVNAAILVYQAKIDEAYSGYLPRVGITGSFAQNINSYKSGITNKFNNQLWTISLGTEIPLFNGFRTSNEISEAKFQLNKIEEEKSYLQDAVILQVKDALKRIETAVENVNNTLQAKGTATESRSLNERAFQQDMAEAKDLIEAQIMESVMEIQYQKALYDYNDARAHLMFLTGKD